MKKLLKVLLGFLILAILVVAGSYFAFKHYNTVKAGEFEVFEGASARDVTKLLESYGIVKNADVLYVYIKAQIFLHEREGKTYDLNFKYGKYNIENGDFDSLIGQLNENPEFQGPASMLTIPEGSTIEQIASYISEHNLFSEDEFLQYIQNPETYNYFKQKYNWLPDIAEGVKYPFEGYLSANTHYLDENITLEQLVDILLKETNSLYERHKDDIISSNYNFSQLITIASIVERESKFKEDRSKVAQVIFNRLNLNMKLEMDSTSAYANGEHKVFMLHSDVATESPYNTYRVEGLPIGPISAPSKDAFLGTIRPEGDSFAFLYFYSRPNGETLYANTFEEHEQNRIKYESEWLELLNNQ